MIASTTAMTNGDITPPIKNNNTSNTSNFLKQTEINRDSNDGIPTAVRDKGRTKSPTASHNKNHVNTITMVDNLYTDEDKCERIFNHVIKIKFERNMYTTQITVEFREKNQKSITTAKLHCDIFDEKLIIDPTAG